MNCKLANEMNIAGFLRSKGISPNKTAVNCFWYCSLLRNEKEPSFKVDRDKIVWYDFGTATGGGLADLVCKTYHVDIQGALTILSGVAIDNSISPFPERQYHKGCEDTKLEI